MINKESVNTWIIYDDDHKPDNSKFIVFIGKKGKVGVGLTDTISYSQPLVKTGGGAHSDYWYQDIYAWQYLNLPEEIIMHFVSMNKQFGFSSLMEEYINNLIIV